ncbi:penicillin-binding transpeptidase domain-containing protein [soil metagenome]
MNRQLKRLGVGLMACYLALFLMLNYVQVLRAGSLNSNPLNTRAILRDFDRPRGEIVSADGVVLAETVPAPDGDRFEFQRQYPTGDLFGPITGYLNFNFGATGVERTYNDELVGQATGQELQSLSDLFVDRDQTGDVTLTVRADVQEVARNALGNQRGAVVAVDPRDGAILALWGFPTFDPNPLSSHDLAAAQALKEQLEADANRPLRARSYQERFFPGSTFKFVTASVGVDSGRVTRDDPAYPVTNEYDIDFTDNELNNFGGSTCGGALFEVLAVSCNTAFAEMAADTVGQELMTEGAQQFGFNDRPPIDLPAAASSAFPTEFPDDQGNGPVARAGIGQGDVASTPLQMALVAAGIANNGVIMTPHVMAEVRDDEGEVVDAYEPVAWKQAVEGGAAQTIREAMVGVVEGGTASGLAIDGVEVAGKTGTAQLGTEPPSSHAWIIGFAGPPGGQPTVAVAVIVEAQPGVSEITGGRVAAPIARAVMEKVLEVQAGGGEGGG